MVRSVFFRRFVALLLCFVLVGSSFAPSASAFDPVTAASLAITGGQLAGGALAGEAGAASLAGPVGVVVGLTLGALGVNAYVSKAAQDAGKTRTRFVLDNLVIWGYKAGYAKEQLYKKIAQGISVAADGTIQLSHDVAKMIEQFGSWLFTQEGAVVPSVNSSTSTITIGSFNFAVPSICDLGSLVYTFPSASTGYVVAVAVDGNNVWSSALVLYSTTNCPYQYIRENPNGSETRNVSWRRVNNDLYTAQVISGGDYSSFVNFLPNTSYDDFTNLISGESWSEQTTTAHDEVFTGTPESWAENKDVLNPSSDDTSIVLNPDLVNPIIDSLTEGQQATMTVIDYLQALQDTWDHALDDVQTAIGTITDTLTGIEEQIEITQEAIKNPTITNPSIEPITTPILDPSVVDPESVVPGFSFPLDEIFPFCIPFDVVAALELFDVPAEAPFLHVHWELPYNIVFDFDLDLSAYDDIAALLRVMETILFAVGLAVATRSLFIRS